MYEIVLFHGVLQFSHGEETTGIWKKETFWLDVRENIFTTTRQAGEQAAQEAVHSLSLKILRTRLNKALQQPGLTL